MADIELAELVENLRSELSKAREVAEGEDLRFEVGDVELELSVVVTKEGGASGKVRFWVLELGGDAKATSGATQRMKLILTPQLAGGGRLRVAGRAMPGER